MNFSIGHWALCEPTYMAILTWQHAADAGAIGRYGEVWLAGDHRGLGNHTQLSNLGFWQAQSPQGGDRPLNVRVGLYLHGSLICHQVGANIVIIGDEFGRTGKGNRPFYRYPYCCGISVWGKRGIFFRLGRQGRIWVSLIVVLQY